MRRWVVGCEKVGGVVKWSALWYGWNGLEAWIRVFKEVSRWCRWSDKLVLLR